MDTSKRDDEEFVNTVMTGPTATQCVDSDVLGPPLKRARNVSDIAGTDARAKGDDIQALTNAVEILATKLTQCFGQLSDRLDAIEKNFEHKILQKVNEAIDKRLNKVTKSIDTNIDAVKKDIRQVEKTCSDAVKNLTCKYSDALKSGLAGENNNSRINNIVIRNMREERRESTDELAVKHCVEKLVRDGLKLNDVTVVEAKRKPGRGDRPGVIVVTVASKDQKIKLMKAKASLRQTREYSSVYIDNDLDRSELNAQSSLRTLIREMGRERDYLVNGYRITKRSEQYGQEQTRPLDNRYDVNRSTPNQNYSRQDNGGDNRPYRGDNRSTRGDRQFGRRPGDYSQRRFGNRGGRLDNGQ
jgi:hypothetical protein